MSIKIGDNNRIKSSTIIEGRAETSKDVKKGFSEKHPILIGMFCSLIVGLFLMFSFWEKIINLIEGFF